MGYKRWAITVAVLLASVSAAYATMTFHDAMDKAMKGDIDNDVVLGTFVREHLAAEQGGDSNRLFRIKANLGALLIDLANKNQDPETYRAMYEYCAKISQELLALDPGNAAGQENLIKAQKNLRIRSAGSAEMSKDPAPHPAPPRAPAVAPASAPPAPRPPVVACLTTIPPRIAGACRRAIDSLLPQVDRVLLAVAAAYDRFGPAGPLPAYLREEPYASRVTVTVGPDHGAATKYLGSLAALPPAAWALFCDDDQAYHPALVATMLRSAAAGGPGAYQNYYFGIRRGTSGGLAHGFLGLLIHASLLAALPAFPLPPAARRADDQWMSAYLHRQGVEVRPTGAQEMHQIFAGGGPGADDGVSLAAAGGRAELVREVEAALGVRFVGWRVVDSDVNDSDVNDSDVNDLDAAAGPPAGRPAGAAAAGGGAAASAGGREGLTYDAALQAAAEGRIGPEVLAAMRWEVEEGRRTGLLDRRSMVNLASLLLDMGNRSPSESDYRSHYAECIALSLEVLGEDPDYGNARANLDKARRNLAARAQPAA